MKTVEKALKKLVRKKNSFYVIARVRKQDAKPVMTATYDEKYVVYEDDPAFKTRKQAEKYARENVTKPYFVTEIKLTSI